MRGRSFEISYFFGFTQKYRADGAGGRPQPFDIPRHQQLIHIGAAGHLRQADKQNADDHKQQRRQRKAHIAVIIKNRIEVIFKVINKINDLMCKFASAFEKCDEADYYQEKLDRLLREAYGDEIDDGFFAFHDRYECVKKFDYTKGRWV